MPGTSSPSSALLFIPMAFGSIPPRRAVAWVHPAGYTQCPALRSMEKKNKNTRNGALLHWWLQPDQPEPWRICV